MKIMKRLLLALVLVVVCCTLAACQKEEAKPAEPTAAPAATEAPATGYEGEVKVWVAEATVEFTKAQVEKFKAAHPEYAKMTVTVQPVGEGDAASNMLTDVEAGADLYVFAQDQLARLVAAGALEVVADENAKVVTEQNDAGSVSAVKLGETMYARS